MEGTKPTAVVVDDPILTNALGLPSPTLIDPVNRKALRTFNSLFRRKKLKHLAVTGLFTAGFVQFCALNLPEYW